MNTIIIRRMSPADLDFAAARTVAEGWYTETLLEIAGFYAYDPQGCLIAELEGKPVGMGFGMPYSGFGFLGELIVLPEVRGQGIGQALMQQIMSYLHACGCSTVFLDGVLPAVPLYERLGFRKICRSLRFRGSLQGRQHAYVQPMRTDDLQDVYTLDRATFGADRSFFLQRRLHFYPALCKVARSDGRLLGFCMGRIGHLGISVGPWVASAEMESPHDLLDTLALEAPGAPLAVGCLVANEKAVETLRRLDFVENPTSPWRMACGELEHPGNVTQNFAIGSPAKG